MGLADAAGAGFVAGFVALYAVLLVASIGGLVFTIFAIVDAARRPDWQFKLGGHDKVLWIILCIVLGWITSLIYWFAIRPSLVAVERAAAAGAYGPGQWVFGQWQPVVAPVPAHPAGWYPDPGGRHRLRYWDGFTWTIRVWDDGPSDDPV